MKPERNVRALKALKAELNHWGRAKRNRALKAVFAGKCRAQHRYDK